MEPIQTAKAGKLTTLVALLALTVAVGCSDADLSEQDFDSTEQGIVARLFERLAGVFSDKALEDSPIAPAIPYQRPEGLEDPAVDELFAIMDLEEVDPSDANRDLDGALVGHFEHYPEPGDPNDFYDDVCFFAKSPNMMPSQETLFWAEMFGFRSSDGAVSDIHGNPIEMECVGCEEGNVGGDETRVIFYVNGIRTEAETHCETLEEIADLTGAVTIGVLNETDGAVRDLWQTAWDRFTVQIENKLAEWGIEKTIEIHENESAVLLTNVVVQRIRQGKHVEIWAHSQGGAVTSLALHRALRALRDEGLYPVMKNGEEYSEAIRVVTFGSAAPKWPAGLFPAGPVYTHFVHLRDATPSTLGIGAFGGYSNVAAPRAGGDAQMVFFDGAPPDPEQREEPGFTPVDAAQADVGFFDLAALKFHGFRGVYLRMFEQQNGSWLKREHK